MTVLKKVDVLWDDNPVDITAEANFIWSIANKLRGSYMPDKYGDVIIPMVIIRRFECTLEDTKSAVVEKFKERGWGVQGGGRITAFQSGFLPPPCKNLIISKAICRFGFGR